MPLGQVVTAISEQVASFFENAYEVVQSLGVYGMGKACSGSAFQEFALCHMSVFMLIAHVLS